MLLSCALGAEPQRRPAMASLPRANGRQLHHSLGLPTSPPLMQLRELDEKGAELARQATAAKDMLYEVKKLKLEIVEIKNSSATGARWTRRRPRGTTLDTSNSWPSWSSSRATRPP
jgi:hypothetical protein